MVEFKGDLGNAPQALMTARRYRHRAVTNNTPGVCRSTTTTERHVHAAARPGHLLDDAALTFGPQQIDIKIGEGNLTYTEHGTTPTCWTAAGWTPSASRRRCRWT